MDGWTRLGSMDTMGSVSAGLFKIVVKSGVTSILLGNSKNFLLFYALEPPCYFKTQYAELHPNENFTNPRSWYVMVTLMKFCLFRSVSTTGKKKTRDHGKKHHNFFLSCDQVCFEFPLNFPDVWSIFFGLVFWTPTPSLSHPPPVQHCDFQHLKWSRTTHFILCLLSAALSRFFLTLTPFRRDPFPFPPHESSRLHESKSVNDHGPVKDTTRQKV